MVSNLTIFDNIKSFPYESPHKKSIILNLSHFWKMPKGDGVALIGFAIWRFSRAQFIKRNHIRTQLLGNAKNTCLATGLEFNTSSGNMSIKNSSCKWLGFSKISYCKWCNWKRRTSKYFTEKLMFLYWIPYLSIYLRNLGKIT